MDNQENQNNYVYPFDPTGIPVWGWGIMLALLFLLFIIGVYFASKGTGPGPQISARQMQISGGFFNNPGAL